MILARQDAGGGNPGLLASLMAAVRLEFRADELVFDPADQVFGGKLCLVAGCGRTARGHGLCKAHRSRWAAAGRPAVEAFAASADSRWRRQVPLAGCQAPGCRYGISRRKGLCRRHGYAWERDGMPDLRQWASGLPAAAAGDQAECLVSGCRLWADPGTELCTWHGRAWKSRGRPAVREFAARWNVVDLVPGNERIFLDALPAQLKLEMQYALQRRNDERAATTEPRVVMAVVRFLAGRGHGAESLLDRTEQEWRNAFGGPRGNPAALLAWSRRQVADLAEGSGWDAEYDRDTWQMHRLGFDGRQTLSFTGIPQPWLRELAKRWIRWRLGTGLSLEAGGGRPLRALARFASFLAAREITGISQIGRGVLESYLADLQARMNGSQQQGTHIGLLGGFFTAIRQHGWDHALPADAMFFPGDHPRRAERLPRALAGHVMTQVEQPGNLAREPNLAYRLATVILIRCGLRITDAMRLPRNCIATGADEAPYLRYYNHKMKREALVPIDDELQALIAEQQQHTLARWPDSTPVLFPRPTKNPDGHAPIAAHTYRDALYRWLEDCDIRDEHGQPVHLTPHQWRHTLGTVLKGRGVASDATFREKRQDTRPALQLPQPSRRAGRICQQGGDDLRCQHPVASNQTMLQPLLLHPATRMMRQMQRKARRRGEMPLPPVRRLRYSAGLVNRSLPVSTVTSPSTSSRKSSIIMRVILSS
ncbi:MAG: tyrosine-type recombinase/integrase [Streptosporangiaceae bacterium]